MSITLPPLPKTIKHWNICTLNLDDIRARDIEVARVVLDAAAKVRDEIAVDADSDKRKPLLTAIGVAIYEGQWGGATNCGFGIRAMEFTHD